MAELAERQHGVVAVWQLRELGADEDRVRTWAIQGWLHRLHHGAYAVGHRHIGPRGTLMAALLACGPGAVLSHRSAAMIWDLRQGATPVPDVSVPRSRERRPGIRIHRPRRLDSQDVTEHEGFPVTTVARTLIDMAAVTTPQQLGTMFEAALRRDLVDTSRALELCHGRRGTGHLRRLIAQATAPEPTRSELEELFRRQCKERRLPPPSFNVLVSELDVDAHWPEQNLVVELDSWEFHRTRAAFERDRARDAKLVAAGHRVMRFTWRQLKADEAWGRLSAALRRP